MDLLVAVLTGGASRRMGADKAALLLGDRTMADWVVDAAAPLGDVIRVGGEAGSVQDAPGSGPLAGLAAAFAGQPHAVLLLATDQPWVRTETLREIKARFDGDPVVPESGGVRQVTCALYPTSLAETAGSLARQGRGLQALLDTTAVTEVPEPVWTTWGEDGRSWYSVDTPADLADGIRRYGKPGT